MSGRPAIASTRAPALAMATAAAVLAGCAVGPNYGGPAVVAPKSQAATAFVRSPAAPVVAAPPLAAWWTALGDPRLDELQRRALRNSPTLAQAAARVRSARASLGQAETQLLPTGSVSASANRIRLPPAITELASGGTGAGGGTGGEANTATPLTINRNSYSLYTTASWQIDLFGGVQRQIESSRATLDAQQAQLEDAQVTLTGDVAKAYVNLRDVQNRLRLAKANQEVLQRMLVLTLQRRRLGTAADNDVETARGNVFQTQADSVPLEGQLQTYADQIAALLGQEPGTLDDELAIDSPVPLPPEETAVGDPASLLRRRPDIRSAERQLASSSALIGANIATYFPSLSLTGYIGFGSSRFSGLVHKRNLGWLAGPGLSWNVLDFPAIGARVAGARADYDEAVEAYRGTVLNALRDAENALSQFGYQRRNVVSLQETAAAYARAADVARRRYAGGTISLIDALSTERDRIQGEQSLAQGQAQLTSYWVSLQGELGLGWGLPGEAGGEPSARAGEAAEATPARPSN